MSRRRSRIAKARACGEDAAAHVPTLDAPACAVQTEALLHPLHKPPAAHEVGRRQRMRWPRGLFRQELHVRAIARRRILPQSEVERMEAQLVRVLFPQGAMSAPGVLRRGRDQSTSVTPSRRTAAPTRAEEPVPLGLPEVQRGSAEFDCPCQGEAPPRLVRRSKMASWRELSVCGIE